MVHAKYILKLFVYYNMCTNNCAGAADKVILLVHFVSRGRFSMGSAFAQSASVCLRMSCVCITVPVTRSIILSTHANTGVCSLEKAARARDFHDVSSV